MLQIKFYAETGNDHITPLTVAHAIIEQAVNDNDEFDNAVDYIQEVAEHLEAFVRTQNNKHWRENLKREREMFENEGKVRPE